MTKLVKENFNEREKTHDMIWMESVTLSLQQHVVEKFKTKKTKNKQYAASNEINWNDFSLYLEFNKKIKNIFLQQQQPHSFAC